MAIERGSEGLIVRLKPKGLFRFLPAAFLVVWLCGWAVGECVAIGFLVKGVLAIMNGAPFEPGQSRMPIGVALGMGAFLLFWLTLWTIGGIGAFLQLLRLVWSEDKLTASQGRLTLVRSLGPFRSRREFTRDELRGLELGPRGCALGIDTTRGRVELSQGGTGEEREEALAALRAELGLTELPKEPEASILPKGWQEIVTPEGEKALVADLTMRKKQARVFTIFGVVMVAIAILAGMQLQRGIAALPGVMVTALFALGLMGVATWLSRGRTEWRIGSGRITQRRRFGADVKDLFDAVRLEVVVSADGESSDCYALEALNDSVEPPPASGQWTRLQSKNRRRIASVLRDPLVPRQLGAWLGKAASIPLEDKTTPEARQAAMELMRDQLEKSGPLGRMAARFITDAEGKRRKSA